MGKQFLVDGIENTETMRTSTLASLVNRSINSVLYPLFIRLYPPSYHELSTLFYLLQRRVADSKSMKPKWLCGKWLNTSVLILWLVVNFGDATALVYHISVNGGMTQRLC